MNAGMGEKDIRTFLSDAREKAWSDQTLVQRTIDMARMLTAPTLSRLSSEERAFLAALSRLVADDANRRFAEQLCEFVFRGSDDAADRLRALLSEIGGIPTFFSSMSRLRLKAASMASRGMQGAALTEMKRVFRATFSEATLTERSGRLSRRADSLFKEGVRLVLNPLQPEVFGEQAAKQYADALASTLVEQPRVGIVVQAVRLFPGMSPASPKHSAEVLAARLRRCITASLLGGGARPIVVETHCSDTLPIIVEGLKQALDSPEYDTADVALELPAYLLSSISLLREMVDWARPRAARGATPLKVLLVKGSHLEEERRTAAIYGTVSQLCSSKAETDANFARLVNAAMNSPAKVITPVVGTHELTHLCYAALRWAGSGREGLPPVCLLYGVGNHIARQFAKMGAPALLRAAVVPEAGENSGVFERYLLSLVQEAARPGGFLAGGYAADTTGNAISDKARPLMTTIGRGDEVDRVEPTPTHGFAPGHMGALLERPYVDSFYEAAQAEKERTQSAIPLIIGGQELTSPLTFIHRSLTVPGLEDYRFSSADYKAVEQALQYTRSLVAQPKPGETERTASLLKSARELRRRSTEFAALLVRDAGFTLTDAQAELRDAIDALRFYADETTKEGFADGTTSQPLGVVVVAAGVAHPLAEAVAGISAAWMGGNTIIYKPAAYSTLLGMRLTELLRAAGVELVCLPCMDNEIGARLLTDPRVDALICTADPGLARSLSARNPQCTALATPATGLCVYLAETCDWRTAVRDIAAAAFRRSGSSPACPLCVMVHSHLYDDPAFCAALEDAVGSRTAKPTWLEGADLGPIPTPLGEGERRLLTEQPSGGASWRVVPRAEEMGALLWQPGLCADLSAECDMLRFGRRLPVLRLMRAESAEQALALSSHMAGSVNFALYSQSEEEIIAVKTEAPCRLLAINCLPTPRPGAAPHPTLRSTLGGAPAPMAGGQNYAPALCHWQEQTRPSMRSARRVLRFDPKTISPASGSPEETMRLSAAADSISYWWEHEFGTPKLLPAGGGLQATLSYIPARICLRIEKAMADADVAIALMAATQAGCRIQLSAAATRPWLAPFLEQHGISFSVQKRAEFEASFPTLAASGFIVRDPAAMEETIAAASAAALPIINTPILANGRIELLYYLEERLLIEPGA